MSPERFQDLLARVGPLITKKPCRSRKPISPAEKLMVTLRYLSTGDSQQTQSFYFRLGRSTISNILRETLEAIWTVLKDDFMKPPSSVTDWANIANEFNEEWNFPNCLGAIDGKHIMMECPKNAGSAYYNYKGFHSLVLLAVCDAKYCFTFVDVGAYGSTNDASVFNETTYKEALEKWPTALNMPKATVCGNQSLPYVLIGDDIFPLKPWLLKPFPGKNQNEQQRIFNYRLSRARRTIENAFGILSAKWRIFRGPIKANVELVELITKATVCLHNYLRLTDNANYLPSGFVDCESEDGSIIPGDWRRDTNAGGNVGLEAIAGNRYTFEAGQVREGFMAYFNNEGSVPWQNDHVRNCGNR